MRIQCSQSLGLLLPVFFFFVFLLLVLSGEWSHVPLFSIISCFVTSLFFFSSLSLFLFSLFSTKTENVATTISLPDLDFWSLGFYRSGSREQLHRHQLQARAWRWEATGWAPGSTNAATATATDWNGQCISTKTSHACNNNNNSNNIWDMVCCQTGSCECGIPRSFGLGLFSATRSRECGLQAHWSKSNLLPPQYLSKSCELGLQSVLSISWSCWLNLQFQWRCHDHI